ncbi:MAG: hypothetical protein WC755_00300 [Candidatus Woesearchaeota archaeon]
MDAEVEIKPSSSMKYFFMSICRMHRENNFNRYESSNVHSIMDNMIKKDHLEIYKPNQTQNVQSQNNQSHNNFSQNNSIPKQNVATQSSQSVKVFAQPSQSQIHSTENFTRAINKDHTNDINNISEQIKSISNTNQKLMEELNKMKLENDKLRNKFGEMENVRLVKLVPKKEGKQPLIISEEEFQNIQKLKNTIDALEQKYVELEKNEKFDEKLLMNHKERIELLKDKLRTSLHDKKN